jgi:TPR repeat protein
MYTYGTGVPEDYTQAYMWFNLSAAQGSGKAKEVKGLIVKKMTREQIDEAQKLSREWLVKFEKK